MYYFSMEKKYGNTDNIFILEGTSGEKSSGIVQRSNIAEVFKDYLDRVLDVMCIVYISSL